MKKQQGLTIIEILVAMLILAIGLLGMASLQVRSVQDTGNSNLRSMAIYLANDMADRIRANQGGMTAGNYSSMSGKAENVNCIGTNGCSESAMANHDKFEWETNIQNALPGGVGTLDRDGDLFIVQVEWTERVKQTDADGNPVSNDTGSITLTFEP